MTTEIYSCKEGQSLKQGKLDYAADITTKAEAEADALRRCARDPSLKKIAYYKLSADGDFRVFYSYTNSSPKSASLRAPATAKSLTANQTKAKKTAKRGLWVRLKGALGL